MSLELVHSRLAQESAIAAEQASLVHKQELVSFFLRWAAACLASAVVKACASLISDLESATHMGYFESCTNLVRKGWVAGGTTSAALLANRETSVKTLAYSSKAD